MSEPTPAAAPPPSKTDILKFLNESLEIAKLRAELQDANTRIATGRAEEIKALAFIGQMLNPKEQKTEEHIVTKEDMNLNPDLAADGIKIGDKIEWP